MRLEVLDGKSALQRQDVPQIVGKGLEALLFECVLGASRYDADDGCCIIERKFSGNRLEETRRLHDWRAYSGDGGLTKWMRCRNLRASASIHHGRSDSTASGMERRTWLEAKFGAEGPAIIVTC